jgi:hypothetical protein
VRKARAAVKIPPEYVELERSISVTPGEVTEAFLKANPGFVAARGLGFLRPDMAYRSAHLSWKRSIVS